MKKLRIQSFTCAALVALTPSAALADDPQDPAMRSAAARARDREMTRQLNLEEMARVRQRDERYANRTRAKSVDIKHAENEEYTARSRDYEHAMARYADDRAKYEREMAAWRRKVAACRAGNYSACD